jgi:hypothetical protein
MAVDAGNPFDRAAIEGRAGSLANQLDDVLDAIQEFKVRLIDDHTQAELRTIFVKQGEDQATSDAKADLVRSAILDLDTLARVARAGATVPAANDFFFNARKTQGVNG